MSRLAVRSLEPERMDDPSLPADVYETVLGDLARVNRWTLAARPTIAFLRRALRGKDRFSLLDVGFGQGDMLRTIARWARRQGVEARLTGADLNSKSVAAARAATPAGLGINFETGDYRDLGEFDIIVSSLVAHHMTEAELVAFLRHMEARASTGWMVNDLHRHPVSYRAYPALARALRVHEIVRHDGRLSIARSFRPVEWQSLLACAGVEAGAARVVRRFPFRLCVERLR